MTKTELLNKTAQSEEERVLLSRVLDKLELARTRNVPSHTGFLSPQERVSVEALLNASGHPRHLFFGGFEGAERCICAFLPDWQEPEAVLAGEECPIRALRAVYTGPALSHRDFLGAVLGLGLDREKVGDLLVGEGRCDLLVLADMQEFLLLHLDQAGRARLNVSPIALSQLSPPAVQVKTIRDTVSSLRLDAVAASAFGLSRGRAAELIAAGRVSLDHAACLKPDKQVGQGAVLTARGLGKAKLIEVGGLTKKGRVGIVIERYL